MTQPIVFIQLDSEVDEALAEIAARAKVKFRENPDSCVIPVDDIRSCIDCTDVAPHAVEYLSQWDHGEDTDEQEPWTLYPGETPFEADGYRGAIHNGLGYLRLSRLTEDSNA